jgi:hypothetical protein
VANNKVNEHHFCAAIAPMKPDGKDTGTRAAVLKSNMWAPGTAISISFLGGAPALQKRVRDVAEEWSKIANLQFEYVPAPTDIRIAFVQGNGSWSYIGTDCRKIKDQNRPTMNFGWLTPASSDEELRSVVLHEFGHAIGLIHEHQNPKRPIKWNKAAVNHDLSGPPNNWDQATIDHNMYKKYEPGAVIASKVDPLSIMMYPIPKAWTLDGFSAGENSRISEKDRDIVRAAYPGR